MVETRTFVGIYKGSLSIRGFLGWCAMDCVHPQYLGPQYLGVSLIFCSGGRGEGQEPPFGKKDATMQGNEGEMKAK